MTDEIKDNLSRYYELQSRVSIASQKALFETDPNVRILFETVKLMQDQIIILKNIIIKLAK